MALQPGEGRIIFEADPDGDYKPDIFILDSQGVRPLTRNDGTFHNYDPAWSADGQRIAFVSSREHGSNIYLMNADGTGEQKLTDLRWGAYMPSWSPDGTHIAFSGRGLKEYTDQFEIYVINMDGSRLVTLTSSFEDEENPTWSPDGGKIAFSSPEGICVMNADGSDRRVVVANGKWRYMAPAWSPDGHWLAFTADNKLIYRASADGGEVTLLMERHISLPEPPSWSPDGRKIAFSDGEFIYVLDIQGGSTLKLVKGENPDWHE